MNYRLLLRPEVEDDLLSAEEWYEEQRPGLGREFLHSVRAAILRLAINPRLTRIRHRQKLIRWIYPDRFPYRIVFSIIDDTVVVYAVLHAARHERILRKRLK